MRLKLLKYQIKLTYVPGKLMFVSDVLSRFSPQKDDQDDEFVEEIVHVVEVNSEVQLSEEKNRLFVEKTKSDSVLNQLLNFIIKGWPKNTNNFPNDLKIMYRLRDVITVKDGLVYCNSKLVVPQKYFEKM